MKNLFLALLIFVLTAPLSQGQSWRRIGGWGNKMTGISWVNEEVGFISGDRIILKTIDGGLSWSEQEAPTKNRMLAVDFFNHNKGLMVGENGEIYLTANGGSNWQLLKIGTSSSLKKVKYLNENRVYIVGENGEAYRSTNGGQTWTKQQVGTIADLNSLYFSNADTGYVATSNGQVIKTFNGGNSWSLGNTGQSNALNDIYFVSGLIGYTVGEGGTILKTTDAASSWTEISSGTERNLIGVSFNKSNPQAGVIVGQTGTLMRTVNGGLTFDGININNSQDYLAASFRAPSNVVFSVGTNGYVISSVNSGGSWSQRLAGVDNNYTGTQFRTANLGYIIGEGGKFLVTSNGGSSLVDRSRPLSVTFKGLAFPSNAFGYIAGEDGVILRTGNSGSNWTSLNLNTKLDINGLYFFSNAEGFAVGDNGFMSKTSDSGITWEVNNTLNTTLNLKGMAFFNAQTGLVIGENGFLALTQDGISWQRTSLPTSEHLQALTIVDEQSAIVIGNKGTVLKTSDQAKTWKKIPITFPQNLTAIDFLDESVGFVAGEKGLMIQTRDGGETWSKMVTGTFQDFSGISFGDLSRGFAVGEKGSLFNYSCQVPETPTVIFGEKNICLSQQTYRIESIEEFEEEFEWRVDGGTILEGQGTNSIVVKWEVPGRNAVLVRGKNNCGNGGIRGLEVLVSMEPQPIAEIIGEGSVCLNNFLEYEVEDVIGTDFIWTLTGGLIIEGQGSSKVKVQWTTLNNQTLKVTPSNPCGNGVAFEKAIAVQNKPSQPSEILGPDRVGFTEEEYQVTSIPDLNYQWKLNEAGGQIISGQGSSKIRVLWEKEGNYELSVSPMNSCEAGEERSLSVNVNIITSLEEETRGSAGINVFPNPSQGEVTVSTQGISNVQRITVVNALGQLLNEIRPEPYLYEYRISELPRGIHTLIILTREREYYRKIIVN
jgi:photosystem II stability/assembly factor-like uncharacterized protein